MTEQELRQWINDLQSGMYINCVYCGHRYGPNEEEIPADALRRHVAECPEHPMAKLIEKCKRVVKFCDAQGGMGRYFSLVLQEAIEEATK